MNETNFQKYGLEPYGAIPSYRQMERYRGERYAFFHFGMNTFTNAEWGEGVEDESAFNPTSLDCRQWIRTIKDAGFTGAILTAKHHDGFCLWPSAYSDHTIKNSPYKDGKGDLVREFTDACREFGIRPGLYLSPWDRNAKTWGTDAYNTYYAHQLTELLTNYGKIYECWWDGAGSTETTYDWGLWAYTVRNLQPDCIIFGSLGATPYVEIRWVGNEGGYAGDPCFATIDPDSLGKEVTAQLNSGKPDGARFIPAEADVSIRPGWFYHQEQDSQVRTPANLVQYWFDSAGSNCLILLNLPPDRRGLVHEIDAKNLRDFSNLLNQTFAVNLAKGALISADSVRCEGCEPENLLNDCEMLFYASDDSCLTPVIHLQLPEKKTFDCFMIQEVIELGHRVRGYAIDVWVDDEWQTLVEKQCIGYRWAEHFDPVTTDQVRIRVISAVAVPVLRSFGLYRLPESVFEERQDLKEKKDLAKGESAKVTVAQKEVIVDFGGIFPFNTVVFNGAGIWSYEVHAFDGTQYFKVFEGQRPDKRQICKFETVRASYKLKLCVNIEIENDLEIEIYDV